MSEAPKLFTNKPTKAQVKQHQQQVSASSSMETHASSKTPIPPTQPPRKSFIRRYKFVWPLLLTVNLAVGALVFMRTRKRDDHAEDGVPNVPATSASVITEIPTVDQKPSSLLPVAEPVKSREPIPVDEQRELFKWLLEEKRKVKPKDAEEKKRVDEEKAILKQFIRAKSIPSL